MAEIFGDGLLSDCGIRDVDFARGGVCDWGPHSVFAEVAEGVLDPSSYPFVDADQPRRRLLRRPGVYTRFDAVSVW